MLNKEEFKKENLLSALKALDCSRNCPCCKYFDNNTQKCQDPTPYAVDLLEGFIQDVFNPQPYKFEDLKEGMWVLDSKEMWIRNIVILFKPCKQYPKGSFKAWADSCKETLDFVEFEENRFFPVHIAK